MNTDAIAALIGIAQTLKGTPEHLKAATIEWAARELQRELLQFELRARNAEEMLRRNLVGVGRE